MNARALALVPVLGVSLLVGSAPGARAETTMTCTMRYTAVAQTLDGQERRCMASGRLIMQKATGGD